MFKKGAIVVYPRYGVGKVIKKYSVKVGEKKQKYYKIKFEDSKVEVSVPMDKAEELGMRDPLSKKDLKAELDKLGDKVKITKKLLKSIDGKVKECLLSGKFEEVVHAVNMLTSLATKKEEEDKNFSYSHSENLEIARNFLKSEVEWTLGKNVVKKHKLDKEL
jgi:CarD family transcriptional regulator